MTSDSEGFACVHSGVPRGHLDHSGSHGFSRARLGVVGIIRVSVVSLGRT